MGTLFKDSACQELFENQGFVQLDLLNEEQVSRIRKIYNDNMEQTLDVGNSPHLYESSLMHDLDWNMRVNAALKAVYREPITTHFHNYELFGGTFMVKVPRIATLLPLHQDWSIVQEDRYQSVFIWTAIVDIHPGNGGLFVIPGSHRFFNNFRSGSMPSFRIEPEEKLKAHLFDISIKAGQAIAYSDRLFHGSYGNPTDGPRIISTARVNELPGQLVYYHRSSSNQVSIIKASPTFYLTDAMGLREGEVPPGFDVLETINYQPKPITRDMVLQKLAERG